MGPNSRSLIEYSYSLMISMPKLAAWALKPVASDLPKSLFSVIMATRFSPIMPPISLAPARPWTSPMNEVRNT